MTIEKLFLIGFYRILLLQSIQQFNGYNNATIQYQKKYKECRRNSFYMFWITAKVTKDLQKFLIFSSKY